MNFNQHTFGHLLKQRSGQLQRGHDDDGIRLACGVCGVKKGKGEGVAGVGGPEGTRGQWLEVAAKLLAVASGDWRTWPAVAFGTPLGDFNQRAVRRERNHHGRSKVLEDDTEPVGARLEVVRKDQESIALACGRELLSL